MGETRSSWSVFYSEMKKNISDSSSLLEIVVFDEYVFRVFEIMHTQNTCTRDYKN